MQRRLFYAIDFPTEVKTRLAEAARDLGSRAERGRWTKPENLHLTLQFLGECPDEWIPDLDAILRLAAVNCTPFNLVLKGAGTFGRSQDILWIGVERHPALNGLAGDLRQRLRQKKLPHEDRVFAPHITVGRSVSIDAPAVAGWQYPAIECPVRELVLMSSCREAGQLIYLPVLRAALTG